MTGRIVGAVVALFGAGLLAVVLNDGGSGPSAAYSRWEGFLLILGTSLCLSGIFLCLGGIIYAVKAEVKSATAAPLTAPSQPLVARPVARRAGLAPNDPADTFTIVCAAFASLALGGLIGLWITTWRPSSASAVATPLTPPPVAQANAAPAEAAPAPAASTEAPAAREETTAAEPRDDGANKTERDERPAPALAAGREDKLPPSRARAERAAAGAATEPASRARGRALPCTLAASPGALTIRGGGAGAVNLRLDETAGAARVSPSTPHWADIAVFAEQQAAGGRASYTVRSVSKRPGVYSVTFRTNCGSRTVPVTVTRP